MSSEMLTEDWQVESEEAEFQPRIFDSRDHPVRGGQRHRGVVRLREGLRRQGAG